MSGSRIFACTSVVLILMVSPFFYGCAQNEKYERQSPSPDSDVLDFWDFGEVKHGDVVEYTFAFRNNSERELQILDVNTSCGCTASKIKKKTLGAHESTSLDIKFKSKGYSGEVKQFIYIITDDPQEPLSRFMIKAEVVKE